MAAELSSKHASDFRSMVKSPWYQRAFPEMRISRSLEEEVWTTARGFRRSTSVYGTLTGLGGDIFIIDDPQKPVDAQSDTPRSRLNHWVSNTLMSRLDSKQTGVIIVVMQRVHLNDLSGYLMESGGWEVLSLPAIAEQDETIAIGEGQFHSRAAGEALHPALEMVEVARKSAASNRFRRLRGTIPAGARPTGRRHDPAGMATLLRQIAGTHLSHEDHSGAGTPPRKTAPGTRLVGLHNLDAGGPLLLFDGCHPWALRISAPPGHSDCAGGKSIGRIAY